MESDEAFAEIALQFKASKFMKKNFDSVHRAESLKLKLRKSNTLMSSQLGNSQLDKESQNGTLLSDKRV